MLGGPRSPRPLLSAGASAGLDGLPPVRGPSEVPLLPHRQEERRRPWAGPRDRGVLGGRAGSVRGAEVRPEPCEAERTSGCRLTPAPPGREDGRH